MRSLSQIILLVFVFGFTMLAQSPHGDKFEIDCSECHEPTNWKVKPNSMQFDHSKTGFPLAGQHQTINCKNCHSNLQFSAIKSDCISCHTDLHQGTVGKDCSKCHTPKSWIVEDINGLHQQGRFPLLGMHKTADCVSCHSSYADLYFEPLNTDCYACHSDDYIAAVSPNHVDAQFSTQCQDCHNLSADSWSSTNINHDFFPLIGGHAISDCFTCHAQGSFSGLSTECYSCHRSDFENTTNPDHEINLYPTDCTQCHSINAWIPSNFNHNNTSFPLTGMHTTVECQSCHTSGYTGTPSNCYACHQQDYELVTDPNHITEGYSTDCTECHTTNGWDDVGNFNHNLTQFPLTGAHISTNCTSCHSTGYSGTSTLCIACHQQNYNNTTNPNHVAANFPTTCEDCHSTTDWIPSTFDHDNLYFPIYTGEHAGEWNLCIDCHTVPNDFTVFSCIDCHEHNQAEMDDKHSEVQGYVYSSEACLSCHPDGSKGNAFQHSQTNFPLTGAHLSVDCQDCHQSGYSGTSTECFVCHETQYLGTTNPNHQALALSTECSSCHSTDPTWRPALFPQHNQVFELLGRHLEIANDCAACHNGNYVNTPDVCIGCHQDDYNNALNPNHVQVGISTECEQCHNSIAWVPSTFDHILTGFQLLGAHSLLPCSSCHQGTTGGLNSECFSCHEDNYNIAPDHLSQNYPHNCELCHNSSNWTEVNFNHNNTSFPLTGAHLTANCADCHESGYTGTSTICIDCHQDDYNNALNPNHTAAGISTTCESCHSTTAWIPSTFNHTLTGFELLGVHLTLQCSNCHEGTTGGLSSECFSCHEDDYNIAPDHLSQNYPHNCELCHNSTNWNEVNFNHNNTNFPLTGAHITVNCADCHESGYTGTTTICYECHQQNYQQSTNPSHTALVLPTECATCHSTNPGWQPATFPIHNNYFQLIGAHALISENCNACHNGNYTNTPNTCIGCHSSDYNATTDPPHQILNFSEDCLLCHNMNGWTPANFNHNFYPISNDHNNVNCNQCHSQPNYQPQCLSCHMEDFLDEHDPGDPTDCWNCHNTSDWSINAPMRQLRLE